MTGRRLRAIDLCSGAGGWACAARGLPIDFVAAFDLWDTACMTYSLNHPEVNVVIGDLTRATVRKSVLDAASGGIDIIVGGIPCEWLTTYRRKGFNNEVGAAERAAQRDLLDSVLDLVGRIQPTFWALEDVIGLIKELPILTPYQVIDSRHFSAQRRKRVFVGRFPPPKRPADRRTLSDVLRRGPYRIGRRAIDREPQRSRTFDKNSALGAWPDRKAPTVTGLSSRRDSEIVVVADELPTGKRQFEWQELAALQGFPEDYVFYGSPTCVAKMIGRAIQIDVGRAILRAMCSKAGL